MRNIEFVKAHENENTVVCKEKSTGYSCVVSSCSPKFYAKDSKAVKVYYNCPDNDDGSKDFFCGEQELEDRFEDFSLQEL